MKDTNDTFAQYQLTFPTTNFLHKHFGESVIIEGNPHRGEVNHDLHTWLRKLFDGVLRLAPRHLLRTLNNPDRVYVFVNGVPASWVDPELESRGLMKDLGAEAFLELCREFIGHCQEGTFKGHDWYQWQTLDDSIWIEKIPGVVRKRRTLAEVLGNTKT